MGRNVDQEWRDFWLPQVCDTLGDFAQRCEQTLLAGLRDNRCNPTGTKWPYPASPARRSSLVAAIPSGHRELDPETRNEALPSLEFQDELRLMIDDLKRGGFIFVLRNDVPPALLGDKMLHRR